MPLSVLLSCGTNFSGKISLKNCRGWILAGGHCRSRRGRTLPVFCGGRKIEHDLGSR
ncbi:hypothetical protein B4135_4005 [Caldibacillus debilis]|uniref:Uncharacterized protein n=1 Tax=Caldibacillus debilis TaxID=301148 RepID=A0A150L7N1_9BACI|nr:hypothetical protein B4135_4005 [Caldibacillus debilis]